jgi:dihydropteroate synthase
MGALNVTPDSFSGDGVMAGTTGRRWVEEAVARALRFEDEGADIVDIGGESTRPKSVYPDARPVSADEEMERVLPVIAALRGRMSAPVSIDTRKAAVARAAAREGAALVNDVSMLEDPEMAGVVAETGLPVVIGHTRSRAEYSDVMGEIVADLSGAVAKAERARVARERIILDPGIGFAKKAEHSLVVMRRLSELKSLDLPVLVGASRKSFIGAVLDLPVSDRLEGTAAAVALAIAGGADIVRVHDVKAMARVARMSDAIIRSWTPGIA